MSCTPPSCGFPVWATSSKSLSRIRYLWINILGDSEISLRSASLLAALLSILLTYVFARRFLDETAALVAAFLMAVSPVHIWYSQEARHYSFSILCVVAAAAAFGRGGRRWLHLYAAAVVAFTLTHMFLVTYLVTFSLLCFLRPEPNRKWYLTWNAVAAMLLAITIFIQWLAGVFFPHLTYLDTFNLPELWHLLFQWFPTGDAVTRWASLPVFAAFAIGLVYLWKRKATELLLLFATVPGFLLALWLVGTEHFYIERAAITALPFFCIVLAAGIRGRIAQAGSLVFVVFVLWNYYHKTDVWTVYKPNPDWRAGTKYLSRQIEGCGGVVPVIVNIIAPEPAYYDHRFVEEGQVRFTEYRKRNRDVLPPGPFAEWKRVFRRALWSLFVDIRPPTPGGILCEASRYDTSRLYQTALKNHSGCVLFAQNLFWRAPWDRLKEKIDADGRFQQAGEFQAKGLRIYRYTVR